MRYAHLVATALAALVPLGRAGADVIPPNVTNDNPTFFEGIPLFGDVNVTVRNNDPNRTATISIVFDSALTTGDLDDIALVSTDFVRGTLDRAGTPGDTFVGQIVVRTDDDGPGSGSETMENMDFGKTVIEYHVLYTDSDGQKVSEPGLATVIIVDLPEPSALALLAAGVAALAFGPALMRRRARASGSAGGPRR